MLHVLVAVLLSLEKEASLAWKRLLQERSSELHGCACCLYSFWLIDSFVLQSYDTVKYSEYRMSSQYDGWCNVSFSPERQRLRKTVLHYY